MRQNGAVSGTVQMHLTSTSHQMLGLPDGLCIKVKNKQRDGSEFQDGTAY